MSETDQGHLLPEEDWAKVQEGAAHIRGLLTIDVDQAKADQHAPTGDLAALNAAVSPDGR